MKQILLFLLCLGITFSVMAQVSPENEKIATELITNHQKTLGLSDDDLQNTKIQNSYFDQSSNAQLVYLVQTYKGLMIHNQYQVLAFKNNQLISNKGLRINLKKRNVSDAVPSIDARMAINTALADRKLPTAKTMNIRHISEDGNKITFDNLGISRESVTAELMWVASKTGPEIYLTWQIYIIPTSSSDYWLVRVDAHSNTVLEHTNLTVYCNWDNPAHANFPAHQHVAENKQIDLWMKPTVVAGSPSIINGASYRVIPYPAESPNHPGGAPTLVTDPWNQAPGNATSLKWHSNGTNDYTFTRGNNVWAKEDRAANNSNSNQPATSTTNDPLTFDFVPNFSVDATQNTPVQNQQFNITNLFYWNNIIHDISYQYGFDEPAGNFQANNQGRGGNANDFVFADAQDGNGFNNANFSTPSDGGSGRMQMYLWGGNPRRDGDVDNGVVSHEFTHGISNRLTGGGNSGCLNSSEQMGEGWSDYVSLMVTQNWATAGLNDGFDKPRGIGTYLAGQPITGTGIRSQRYTTNFAINNKTYNTTIPSSTHDRGEIWCATLWDMTWNIIQQVGAINPNFFDANAVGGNSIALKLVMQGMKLQVCDPGFLDGRDAILAADQLLYSGQYRCAIIAAFARRGMGFDAKQGSAYSTTDQTPGFSTAELQFTLTQSVTQQAEGQQVTYTHTVSAGACSDLTNYTLRDTLPANVAYVSGGTYNATTRVVSFAVNVTAGSTETYAFTVSLNVGSFFPTETILNETVAGTTLPTGWTTASGSALNWVSTTAQSHSPANALFASDEGSSSDFSVITPSIATGAIAPILSFWHSYNTEDTWDGGVVELSTNNGVSWADLGNNMIENPYNALMGTGSAIESRNGFSGNSNGFIKTTILLDDYANQNIKIRFRFASDNNTGADGWYVDDIEMKKEARVHIHATLFNASNIPVAIQDTFTLIVEDPLACHNVQITTEPDANVNACPNSNTSFSVVASGSNPTYQWQVSSTGCNGAFIDIAGANSATYNLTNVTTALNNFAYRVIVSNDCPSADTSNCITLHVNNEISINTQPVSVSKCTGETASFSVAASGTGLSYQWQVSSDGGASYGNISNATSATLNLTNLTAAENGNLYRVQISGTCSTTPTASAAGTLTVFSPVTITQQPVGLSKCIGNNVDFSIAATGTGISYQWQQSTDGGNSFSDISGATNASYSLTNVQLVQNDLRLRVQVSSTECAGAVSNVAELNVTNPPTVSISSTGTTGITPNTSGVITATAIPAGNYTYQWQRNGSIVPGAEGSDLTVSIDQIGNYTVTVMDETTGCTASSNAIAVTESASDVFFVYPSPNNGTFQVRYYSADLNIIRKLNIYDSKGARVYSRIYDINSPYTMMYVDLRNASAGVYLVELLDKDGDRIALGKTLVQ